MADCAMYNGVWVTILASSLYRNVPDGLLLHVSFTCSLYLRKAAHERLRNGGSSMIWKGHLYAAGDQVHQDNCSRPMDLRASSSWNNRSEACPDKKDTQTFWKLLISASNIAQDIRTVIKVVSKDLVFPFVFSCWCW